MQPSRKDLYTYVKRKYKAAPEYLWARYPDYAIFRHADNKKWFGLIMSITVSKLGLDGDEIVDILNVKLPDPLLAEFLIQQDGYFKGYHMSRGSWISILLDGSVPFEDVCNWIDESYIATASKEEKKRLRPPKEWIIPANPRYYDIEHAFDNEREIVWKQGNGIKKGDIVFMYVAAPISAILYKCKVTKTDIPFHLDADAIQIKSVMRIRLMKRYKPDKFTFDVLGGEYGIFAVRGPRGIPESLSEALK